MSVKHKCLNERLNVYFYDNGSFKIQRGYHDDSLDIVDLLKSEVEQLYNFLLEVFQAPGRYSYSVKDRKRAACDIAYFCQKVFGLRPSHDGVMNTLIDDLCSKTEEKERLQRANFADLVEEMERRGYKIVESR